MLDFAEKVLYAIRMRKKQAEDIIIGGGIKDMEHYKFLMGRIEGCKFVEDDVLSLLKKNSDL